MMTIAVVGVDGDDTLWFHERIFVEAQERLSKIVHRYVRDDQWAKALNEISVANLGVFGYGIKSFVLSVLEAAAKITDGQIKASELLEIIDIAKEMLTRDVDVISGVDAALQALGRNYHLVLITKGDMSEQHGKLQLSRLAARFGSVEVVREKSAATYERILNDLNEPPDRFVMVGNSIKSDVNPVLSLGGWAIHVPSDLIWSHEEAEPPAASERYFVARDFEAVPRMIENISLGRVRPAERQSRK
jgi:putative hydrolase of the HAD superfamily